MAGSLEEFYMHWPRLAKENKFELRLSDLWRGIQISTEKTTVSTRTKAFEGV